MCGEVKVGHPVARLQLVETVSQDLLGLYYHDDDDDDIICEQWTSSTTKRLTLRLTIVMEMTVDRLPLGMS